MIKKTEKWVPVEDRISVDSFYPAQFKKPIHSSTIDKDTGQIMTKKRIYTVWFVPTNEDKWLIYHCPDCKNPIAQYKGELVAEVPGLAPKHLPVMIQCRNKACGRKIVFADATEQVE